jgi:hypothetical protein
MSSLDAWAENKWLKRHTASTDELRGMAAVVERNLREDEVHELSLDARVSLLYQACRVLCDMALRAAGYRTSGEGHHEYVIRSLSLTLGHDWKPTVDILNAARAARSATTTSWSEQLPWPI